MQGIEFGFREPQTAVAAAAVVGPVHGYLLGEIYLSLASGTIPVRAWDDVVVAAVIIIPAVLTAIEQDHRFPFD